VFAVHIAKVLSIHVLKEALSERIFYRRGAAELLRIMQKTLMCIYVKKFVFCPKSEHISLWNIYISTPAK